MIAPVPFPRGVAAPDGTSGFFELSTGGVAAIELASGADLWQVTTRARPRLVVGQSLVAQDLTESHGNVLRFVLLNIRGGGSVVLSSEPVRLPDWVSVADPEQAVHVEIFGNDDHVVVAWRAQSHYQGGAPPPAPVEARDRRASGGRIRVDLVTGKVRPEPVDAGRSDPDDPRVSVVAESAPYLRDLSWHDSPWRAGGYTAALARLDAGGQLQLRLRRWRDGTTEELPAVILATSHEAIADVTPDGLYLFVRVDPAGGAGANRRWDVFSVTTGLQIGSVPYEDGAAWPCVVHKRAFYLVEATRASAPRRSLLKAFDPTTGQELWTKVLPEAAAAVPPARRM